VLKLARKMLTVGAVVYTARDAARRYAADHPEQVRGWIDKATRAARTRFESRADKVDAVGRAMGRTLGLAGDEAIDRSHGSATELQASAV